MTTTIAVEEDIRDRIKEFGHKGETYSEILGRILKAAQEQQIKTLLMDTTNTIPVQKALEDAKRRWRK